MHRGCWACACSQPRLYLIQALASNWASSPNSTASRRPVVAGISSMSTASSQRPKPGSSSRFHPAPSPWSMQPPAAPCITMARPRADAHSKPQQTNESPAAPSSIPSPSPKISTSGWAGSSRHAAAGSMDEPMFSGSTRTTDISSLSQDFSTRPVGGKPRRICSQASADRNRSPQKAPSTRSLFLPITFSEFASRLLCR